MPALPARSNASTANRNVFMTKPVGSQSGANTGKDYCPGATDATDHRFVNYLAIYLLDWGETGRGVPGALGSNGNARAASGR
jgi:hypothetical protein